MSTIVTRSGKGSPLTNTEVDANFTNLNTDKAELSGATFTGAVTANAGVVIADDSDPTLLIRTSTADQANSGRVSFREASGGTTGVDLKYNGATNTFSIDTTDVANALTITRTTGAVTINEAGADADFRVESSGNDHMLFVDGGNNTVSIGTSTAFNSAAFTSNGGLNGVHAVFSGQAGRGLLLETEATTNNDDTVVYNAQMSSGQHSFETNGTERFNIASDGAAQFGFAGAALQKADSQALTITTPASGGGQGIALKRLDTNTDQGLGEISWSNNTQDGQANIRVKTAGAANTTDMAFDISNAGTVTQVLNFDGSAGGAATFNSHVTSGGEVRTTNINTASSTGTLVMYGGATNKGGTIELSGGNNTGATGSGIVFKTGASTANPTEKMRISSSGNVGIGRAPDTVYSGSLQFALGNGSQIATSTAGNPSLTITDNSYLNASGNHVYKTTNPSTKLEQYNGTLVFSSAASGTAGATISYTERMAIDSTGITTFTKSGGGNIRIAETASRYVEIMGYAEGSANGSTMAFHTIQAGTSTSTERARLNSSGDWMVSNTVANVASNYSTQGGCGWVESDNHFEIATTSNRAPLEIGKNQANDGDLIVFRKQGTPVGSIGVDSGRLLLRSEGDASGLRFDGSCYTPFKNSSEANGTVDLGYSGARFKDLYLSSGVYLGGTGAANKLDDYEEGTWTPVIRGNTPAPSGQSYATQNGRYTKLGRLVTLEFDVTLSAKGTVGGSYLIISGVPFSPDIVNYSGSTGIYFESMGVSCTSVVAATGRNDQIFIWVTTAAQTSITRTNPATNYITDDTRLAGSVTFSTS